MERFLKKKSKNQTWFRNGEYQSFIMVPATPHSKLKKMIEAILEALKLKEKVKIIEKPDQKFIQVLKNINCKPKRERCQDPKCLVGRTENGGDCRLSEILYLITCKVCKAKYTGETSRNAHVRGMEHLIEFESENDKTKEKQFF